MKKIKILYVGILIICTYLLFPGCNDMNDIHQEYLDRKKTVYLGITDSLASFAGEGRVKLKWLINADPKVEETVVYWNMRQDSVVKSFTRTGKGMQADSIIIENLPEGTYEFELVNKNSRGERSLYSSIQGTSYGENFRSTLKSRSVSSMKILAYDKAAQKSDVEISWGARLPGTVGTRVTYKKRSNGEKTVVFVPAADATTKLSDIGNRFNHPDDLLKVSTLHFPAGSIDTIATVPHKEQICIYSASGTRTDYTSDGTVSGTTTYNDVVKMFYRVSSSGDVYDCNWVGESPALFPTQFRMTVSASNTIKTEGYFNGLTNTITNEEEGVYLPQQQKLKLKYRYRKSGGAYSIVEEEFIPADITLPIVPTKVYSLGNDKSGLFFTVGEDLFRFDGSRLEVYKANAEKSFNAPTQIASGWPNYRSVFYMPNNRVIAYDGSEVYSYPLDNSYNVGARATIGWGWGALASTMMPFKNLAIVMVNGSGEFRKIQISQSNGWGSFTVVGTGFDKYTKIIPYENAILAIDNSGNFWHMTLTDDYVLGAPSKLGSGWGKYLSVVKQGRALLCIDNNGDLWRYDFNTELSWNID